MAPTSHSRGRSWSRLAHAVAKALRREVNARAVSAWANAYRDSRSDQKRRPRHHRGRSLRLSAVWGTFLSRPLVSDAPASDRISIFREVMAITQRQKPGQQDRHQGKPPALHSPPVRAVFFDGPSLGAEPAVKVDASFTLVPTLRSAKRGDVQSDQGKLSVARRLFAASRLPHA